MKKACLFLCASLALAAPTARSAPKADASSWPGWGNSSRFDRYSPAGQINTGNVRDLRPVWKYTLKQSGGWEVTPIVADGVLYAQDLQGTAFALDPESGRELWRFATGAGGRMRAVAWWPGEDPDVLVRRACAPRPRRGPLDDDTAMIVIRREAALTGARPAGRRLTSARS